MKPPERVKICDHLTLEVEQRTAGVARVDGHVGLDEGHIAFVGQAATLGADDTGGDRVIEAEGRTDGQDPFTDLELIGIAQLEGGQVLGVDFQQGHVGTGIRADQLGGVITAVGQPYQDLVGIGDHMVVGQDVAIGRDDEARPQGLGLLLLATGTARHLRDAALEEFTDARRQAFQIGHGHGAGTTTFGNFLAGADVDDRRRCRLDQAGEIRQIGPSHGRQSHQPEPHQGGRVML